MEKRAFLADVGEYTTHQEIASFLNQHAGAGVVGDDAAILPLGQDSGSAVLISTDRLAAGVPAPLRAGLLVAQTLSDVICMGGTPLGLVVAVQWPRASATIGDCMSFIAEIEAGAARYGCHLVGGDTKEGADFAAVGTVVASADPRRVIRRRQAGERDLVVVTSAAAKPWGGRWANQLAVHYDLPLEGGLREHLAATDLQIDLPLAETRALLAEEVATTGLDLSDGIGASLQILARANGLGFNILPEALDALVDPAAVPVTEALGLSPRSLILSPGYMWENMYTVSRPDAERAVRAVESAGGRLTVIAEAVPGNPVVRYGGVESPVAAAASDEKFRPYAWEDRIGHWVDAMRTAQL